MEKQEFRAVVGFEIHHFMDAIVMIVVVHYIRVSDGALLEVGVLRKEEMSLS